VEDETETRVESNARLTAATGAILVALLALEGATIVAIHRLLTLHEFVGIVVIPPVLLKLATTGYRFLRYYRRDPAFRRKGPPPVILRLLGPFVVVLTITVIGSGVALLFAHGTWRGEALFVHKASFVLWFGAMTIHVLGHLVETARLAPRDWYGHSRHDVARASRRQWAVVSSVIIGIALAAALVPYLGGFYPSGR
jgi:hypothetical protein